MDFFDPCTAWDAEIASFGDKWGGQIRDFLEMARWYNDCPNKVVPNDKNWGATFNPPPNPNLPPNPDDR